MILSTFEHDYEVVSITKSTDDYDFYLCGRNAGRNLYTVMSVKNKNMLSSVISTLSSLIKADTFTDYAEHFTWDGKFCIAMKYSRGISLSEKLEEGLSLKERAEIFRRILENIVLQDIPPYFLTVCLREDNIIVDRDLQVHFNYPIFDLNKIENIGREDAAERCISIFKEVFDHEIKRNSPDLLMEYLKKIGSLKEKDRITAYAEYYDLYVKISGMSAAELGEPKSIWFRMWAKIKGSFKYIKRIVAFFMIAAALIYLIFTANGGFNTESVQPNFDKIGTVEIENKS